MEKFPLTIFKESTRDIKISEYYSYSSLDDKPSHKLDFSEHSSPFKIGSISEKQRHYFNTGVNNTEYVSLKQKPLNSDLNEEYIKKSYKNPFASITISCEGRSIKKCGDKLTILRWYNQRTKRVNKRFFNHYYELWGITINFKTGNIYSFKKNSVSKMNNRITVNEFNRIKSVLYVINSIQSTQTRDFSEILINVLNVHNVEIDKKETDVQTILNLLMSLFVDIKKIKVPNDYKNLLLNYYPTEKLLKKNDRKLTSAILEKYGLKSKSIISLVHEQKNISFCNLVLLKKLFGTKFNNYITAINKELLCENGKNHNKYNIEQMFQTIDVSDYKITEQEKKSMVKIINNKKMFNGHFNLYDLLIEFYDHIKMNLILIYNNIPHRPISSNTMDKWNIEHSELSAIVALIKKGKLISLSFNDELINSVEQTRTFNEYIFKPYILKNEIDYVKESKYMHHCVSTYINRENSLIVSLRCENNERITCEFDINNGNLLQARSVCNAAPPVIFNEPLKVLEKEIKKLSYKNVLKTPKKIYVNSISLLNNDDIEIENTVNNMEFEELDFFL